MKILDKYILFSFIKTFLFAIMVLSAISCVVDYSEKVDNFVKYKVPLIQILFYFGTFIPWIVALLYPLFIFISTIFFTSRLAYRSEIIATLASGVSFTRFLRPYVIGSIIIGFTSLAFNHFLVPWATKYRYKFENQYIRPEAISSEGNVHLKLSPNLYVYVQSFNFQSNTGNGFTAEVFDGVLLKQKLFAENINYIDSTDSWELKYVTVHSNDGLKESISKSDRLVRKFKFKPNDLQEDEQRIETIASPQLYNKTKVQNARGLENLNSYAFELHRRTTESVAGFILTIIAVCVASRKIRGGSGLHLFYGILLSAFYLIFMRFSKTFSINANVNPLLAAWIPNIVFSFVAIYFYLRRRK